MVMNALFTVMLKHLWSGWYHEIPARTGQRAEVIVKPYLFMVQLDGHISRHFLDFLVERLRCEMLLHVGNVGHAIRKRHFCDYSPTIV